MISQTGENLLSFLFSVERKRSMETAKLNETVALNIMDYQKQVFKGQNGFGTSNGLVFFSHFNPAENINDAWKVVDKLREKEIKVKIENNDSNYIVEFCDENQNLHTQSKHKNIEQAICQAALKLFHIKSKGEITSWKKLSI